ncbi:MAG: extracellular solute-binding protein [Pedosphaera parvula]|nr:extracellular solute-binding protein [Verrucomicrobiota bacterium]MBI3191566.1 extracellular solute-binding protein [Pedosphaera parvula]
MSEGKPERKEDHWYKDMLAYGLPHYWQLLFVLIVAIAAVALLPVLDWANAKLGRRTVIVYTSQDHVYAEPIFREFQRQTGIKVRAVYDSEAVKTVGLANRLLAEKSNPQADVFWGNEELRTRQLAAQGVFRKEDPWRAFGYRSRRVVVNTNLLSLSNAPHTLTELTNETWRGKVALAYPLFGTTATHFLALRQHWGEARWLAWCRALQTNNPFLVDGNSIVVRLVGKGEAWLGLTDSDDIAAGQREGYPIAVLPLNEESLLIPNTVAIVRGARHPTEAQQLFEHLRSPGVLDRLVAANALEGETSANISPPALKPDWDALLRDLETGTAELKRLFLR